MSTDDDKQKKSSKGRGLSVQVTQEKKDVDRENVRVNSYFSKNDTRRKKKVEAAKKSVKKAEEKKAAEKAKKAEKTTEKVTEKTEKVKKVEKSKKKVENKSEKSAKSKIKSETKKPASFSKTTPTKVAAETKKDAKKAEKVEKSEKIEKVETAEAEKVVVKEEKKVAEKAGNKVEEKKAEEPKVEAESEFEFETLAINTDFAKPESKIILRDVAKPDEKVENAPVATKTFEEFKAEIEAAEKAKVAEPAKPTTQIQPAAPARPTAKEIKEREIEKAVKTATKLPETSKKRSRKSSFATNFGWPRMVLAVACAATAVFAIVYFVNLTSVDMSLKVAAMQSGIEASYPSYVPRGYNLSDVTSSSGKVTMNFKTEESAFAISEENTTWDSDALLSNYIRPTYDDSYTVVREQGLTLYMGDSWEAWVNGGILYKLNVKSGSLTKKQMKTIAASL